MKWLVVFVAGVILFSTAMTLSVVDRVESTGWGIALACVVINVLMDFAAIMMAVEEYKACR